VTGGEGWRAVGISCLGGAARSVDGCWAVAGLGVVAVRVLLSCISGIDWWMDLQGIQVAVVLRREVATRFLRDEPQ
jgi:hypothetical protein